MTSTSPIADLVHSDISLVDIGSRNGILELQELRHCIEAYGFEPAPEEYEKLKSGVTDLDMAIPGMRQPYKKELYYPYAITGDGASCRLYITRGIGASSTIRPNVALTSRFRHSEWYSRFDVMREETVPARTLPQFLEEASLKHIDYLKLDTQGNEYDILATDRVLDRISIIKTEVEFLELYKDQKLYADITKLLYAAGFVQFDLKFEPVHFRKFNPEGLNGGILTWADAYFVNMNISDANIASKQVAILLSMGKDDIALEIVRRHRCCSEEVYIACRQYFADQKEALLTIRQRIQRLIHRMTGYKVSRAP